MSKRSPFWRAFTAHTPLGYTIIGQFNTELGPNFGAIRFTHVDKLLPRPYIIPGLPTLARPALTPDGLRLPVRDGLTDIRAVERLDGALIAFYPLFDEDGSLVEVVPRTGDTVVALDTPWRPLGTLVRQARHAGIEEAVRRQRAVFVFSLIGSANRRLVEYPFELRLFLHSVLRNNGRALATYAQMRNWANQYGLDLPTTRMEFDAKLGTADMATRAAEAVQHEEQQNAGLPIGAHRTGGLHFWLSGRTGAELLEWPARVGDRSGAGLDPVDVWQAMARLADQCLPPTRDRLASALALDHPDMAHESSPPILASAWESWASRYPEAFSLAEEARLAV